MKSIAKGFLTFPPLKVWGVSFIGTALLLVFAWLAMPDFIDYRHRPSPRQLALITAVAFVFPAFCEELVFRGILNWAQSPFTIFLSVAAFVAWHPLEAYLFLPDAILYFTDPRFLGFVAVFGFWFCILRKLGQSFWPPIFCHLLVVVVWKGLGGAQFLTSRI